LVNIYGLFQNYFRFVALGQFHMVLENARKKNGQQYQVSFLRREILLKYIYKIYRVYLGAATT